MKSQAGSITSLERERWMAIPKIMMTPSDVPVMINDMINGKSSRLSVVINVLGSVPSGLDGTLVGPPVFTVPAGKGSESL